MKNTKYCFLLLALVASAATAQKMPEHPDDSDARNKGNALLVHLAFGAHLPGGDLADRFGTTGSVGGGLEWMTAGNYTFGAEGHYFFGQDVKEDPLTYLRTPEGDIIGSDQLIASVVLRERGYYVGGVVGKLFPITKARSGLRVTLGAGWLEHKIRVQDDSQTVTQLTGDYLKGYDRRTGGLALQQYVGWQHLGEQRKSNWSIGLEINEGFTQTLRDWDFAERRKLDGRRLDLRFGLRLMWTLPFYFGKGEEIYY